ncbi:hypothetical protein GOP47_0014190 [Adiantum capillus-veneris]|uniref:Pentatricopeptide repeat-containing protein n=1 Tax=Adiantum capillus-veneris TaxID=13818 RepID=A0A9D4UQG4_ADICA|nr:hypothetical protein GOP47_0014190 [Adiantum capillus-veneris]
MFFFVTQHVYTARKHSFHSQIVADLGGLHQIYNGQNLGRALQAVEELDLQGKPIPKDLTYCILQGCTKRKDLAAARRLRPLMVKQGMANISLFADYLIRLLALCGCLPEAEEIFHMVAQPSIYTWNAIISAHAILNNPKSALEYYHALRSTSIKPSKVTFLSVLKACASLEKEGLDQGRLIHNQLTRCGLDYDGMVGNALVDMYAKCGNLNQAQEVFDELPYQTVVSYGALIAGYANHGLCCIAFELFEKMQKEGIQPNRVVFLCLVKACSKASALEQGIQIHERIIKNGLLSDVMIGSALVDMYVKCESLARALLVFEKLPSKNLCSWGAMIGGFVEHGDNRSAFVCFAKMQQDGIEPDRAIFLVVLRACASHGCSIRGKIIHHQIVKSELERDVSVGNTLVDMYAKCGNFDESHNVFDRLSTRDIVSWGALIAGYAVNGHFSMVLDCVKGMQQSSLNPSEIIFTSVLAGCSNVGLVKQGYEFLNIMVGEFGITPSAAHYNCMVDLLGRTGCLVEAWKLLQSMPIDPTAIAWRSLLAGCKIYGDKELGQLCFEEITRLDPIGASSFTMMSNMYDDAHMWEDSVCIQDLKRSKGVWKKPGRALIEIGNNMHEFIVGERLSGETDQRVRKLAHRIFKEGYVPDLSGLE